MNQILAVVVLFGVVTAVLAPVIWESGSQISTRTETVSDVADSARQRTGQIIVPTHTQQGGGIIDIYISNIGIEDVRIHAVLVDGTESAFVLYDQDSAPIDVLGPGRPGVLKVTGSGDRIQLVTTIGKLFEYDIS